VVGVVAYERQFEIGIVGFQQDGGAADGQLADAPATSSSTLAPKPIICAVPRLPLVQAIHAMIATIARTTIMPAKRTRFAVMASALDLLGSGFCAVFVGFRIALHDISITIEGR
jgi:hypothetical protein